MNKVKTNTQNKTWQGRWYLKQVFGVLWHQNGQEVPQPDDHCALGSGNKKVHSTHTLLYMQWGERRVGGGGGAGGGMYEGEQETREKKDQAYFSYCLSKLWISDVLQKVYGTPQTSISSVPFLPAVVGHATCQSQKLTNIHLFSVCSWKEREQGLAII